MCFKQDIDDNQYIARFKSDFLPDSYSTSSFQRSILYNGCKFYIRVRLKINDTSKENFSLIYTELKYELSVFHLNLQSVCLMLSSILIPFNIFILYYLICNEMFRLLCICLINFVILYWTRFYSTLFDFIRFYSFLSYPTLFYSVPLPSVPFTYIPFRSIPSIPFWKKLIYENQQFQG